MSEAEVKVTLNPTPTPTDEVIAKAKAEVVVFDKKGRAIKLKKPGTLATYRLIDMLGQSAANSTYVNMVLPLIYVAAIDDEPVFKPTSKREVEALITRLEEDGADGVDAVMLGVHENYQPQDPEEQKAAIKN